MSEARTALIDRAQAAVEAAEEALGLAKRVLEVVALASEVAALCVWEEARWCPDLTSKGTALQTAQAAACRWQDVIVAASKFAASVDYALSFREPLTQVTQEEIDSQLAALKARTQHAEQARWAEQTAADRWQMVEVAEQWAKDAERRADAAEQRVGEMPRGTDASDD